MRFITNIIFVTICQFSFNAVKSQIANYVNNPSFEKITISGSVVLLGGVHSWTAIDSAKGAFALFTTDVPYYNAPNSTYGFQYPKTGKNFIGSSFYCGNCVRWYPRNRLMQKLKANTVYCAKFHVVNTNNNVVGIADYSIYFGDETLDTIKNCYIPLTYLNPQIENQTGIISDTLNWIPITGTFVATGSEKYMVLGNFKSNPNTQTVVLNPAYLPNSSNDIYIDDVSLMEIDLPAYAGLDKSIALGDSVFIGREPDIGIDEACIWYNFSNMSLPIDTIAGIWVKPSATSTYVVRQQLWCSSVKFDTVVVYMNLVGIEKIKLLTEELKIYPIPAKDNLELRIKYAEGFKTFTNLKVYNQLGELLHEEELYFKNNAFSFNVTNFPSGVYSIELISIGEESIRKRFVVSH